MATRRRAAQQGDDNAVRGPTSALTSFLRDQGIVSRPRHRDEPPGNATAPPFAATPFQSTSRLHDPIEDHAPLPTPPAVEEPEADPLAASTSGGKRKRVSEGKKKKGKKGEDDADDWELDFAGSKKGRYDDRKPGDFTLCAECHKKFTVTKYTKSLPGGDGQLCMSCEKEMGDLGLSDQQPKKKARAVRAKPAPLEKVKPDMPTLQENCIKIIGQCIEDLEEDSLGDVGPANMERICKIVCKNRALTEQTVRLFLEVNQQELKLFDCSRIDDRGFTIVCNLAPNLRSLTLRFCGLVDDTVMAMFAKRLTQLCRLELYGPFLVTGKMWREYFDSLVGRDFEAFRLQQCPRFDMDSLHRLAENVPNLVELQLADLVKLSDNGLKHIHNLRHLRHLDISRAGSDGLALTDDGVVPLIQAVGTHLETLILDLNTSLTDRVLVEGIQPHCRHLTKLSLRGLGNILGTGLIDLFSRWDGNPPLTWLDLHRVLEVDDDALAAILVHSGPGLRHLDLNSCDLVTETGLNTLATTAAKMEKLDLSFVRAMDDFAVKALLDHMPALRLLNVFGNNRVTDTCPRKPGVLIRGQEAQFDVNASWDV